jgi:tetratricopeptide (TPR) repeat protein
LWRNLAERQLARLGAPLLLIGVFTAIEFIPVSGTGDLSQYYARHAVVLEWHGREDEAMGFWEESLRMKGEASDFVNLALARRYRRTGNYEKALWHLTNIPDTSSAASAKYENLGDVAVAQARAREAIAAYERSLEINSGVRRVRRKLIRIYDTVDDVERAEKQKRVLEYIQSFHTEL